MDNESYVETGSQPTATAGKTDLEIVAKGSGIANSYTINIEKLYINDGLSIVNENTPTLNELSNNFITNETNYFISLFNVNSNNKIYNISFDYYTTKIQTYSNGSFQDLSNVYYF